MGLPKLFSHLKNYANVELFGEHVPVESLLFVFFFFHLFFVLVLIFLLNFSFSNNKNRNVKMRFEVQFNIRQNSIGEKGGAQIFSCLTRLQNMEISPYLIVR